MSAYDLSGSVNEKDKSFIETWENVATGVNYIIQENRRGDETYVQVSGPRRFKLSTYDRMLTEDKVVDSRLNPFKNGAFRPVVVPEDVNIESNPNALSADDIKQLFAASDVAWDEYMKIIDSPSTLKRMIDMADDGEANIHHRRFRQLESMLEQYTSHGKAVLAQNDPEIAKFTGSTNEPAATPAKRGPGRPPKLVA